MYPSFFFAKNILCRSVPTEPRAHSRKTGVCGTHSAIVFLRRCKEREGGGRGGGRPFRKEKENGRERDGRGPERPPPGGLGIWGKGGFGGARDRRHGPPISAVRRSDFKFLKSKLVAESVFPDFLNI